MNSRIIGFENNAKITLDGTEYPLLLSTYAAKQISDKFGGLSEMGERLTASNGREGEMIDDLCWVIATLANQPILIRNRRDKKDEPTLTAEDVAIFTTIDDITDMVEAVMLAINQGSSRAVPDGKPTEKN